MTAPAQFSTANAQPQDRANLWNAVITEAYFPLQLHFREPLEFNGTMSRLSLGNVGLSRLNSDPVNYERRPRHIRESREEEYLVTIPRASPVEFRQLGRDVRCEPGGFIIERGDEPYRFMYERPNDLFVVKVSKSELGERVRQPDRFCAQVVDATSGAAALFTSMVEQAQARAPEADQNAGEVIGRHLLELLALVLENGAADQASSASAVRAAHLQRVDAYIRANLKNPDLSPDLIAEACGISKRYLHDLFKDVNGTVSQQVRDQRLIAARDQLEMPSCGSIAEISYRFGFSDQAQFSRLFRNRFGQSPSGFRKEKIEPDRP